nr:immunoglobulin light chain junction region [Macaca mulatta]MOW29528.1 immunoglobulin light chain junction region [Macaca mulatta]MOW30686.1 immunoglobulin light chain junction region [Macaca mulatta]
DYYCYSRDTSGNHGVF